MIRKLFFLLFLLVLASNLVFQHAMAAEYVEQNLPVDEDASSEEDDDSFQNLMDIVTDESRRAADAKTNADFVPDIITILRGEDLAAKGVRTVYEALSLVPGVNLSMYPFGVKKVVIRGLAPTFGTCDLKLLLNGAPANNTLVGTTPGFYDIPVEMVERIDVIRGSGAVVYGENAGSGVINVITRKEGNRIYARYGSFNTYEMGGTFSYERPEKDFKINVNLAGWDTDGADVESGPDSHGNTGPTNEVHQDITAIMAMDYKKFTLLGQFTSIKLGDYFGFGFTLPESGDDRKVQSYENLMIEVRQEFDISENFKTGVKLGFVQYGQDWLAELSNFYRKEGDIVYIYDQVTEDSYYKENRFYGGLDVAWNGWDNHRWIMGISYTDVKVADESIDDRVDSPGPYPLDPDFPFIDPLGDDDHRRIVSLFAQDAWEMIDRLTLTMGLRYDYYSDLDDKITPRLALVYRMKDHHIFKAQYAEGFRPPTFLRENGWGLQLFQPPEESDHETIRTFELGYIFKDVNTDARVTVFYSEVKDLQAYDWDRKGYNYSFVLDTVKNAEMKGVELEFERQLTDSFKLEANLSYVDTKYRAPNPHASIKYPDKNGFSTDGEKMQGSATWLSNFDLIYEPREDITLDLRHRYVGECHGWYDDPRDKLEYYQTVDFTINVYNLFLDGLTLRAGVKNLFDEDAAYPSFHEDLYEDDYPRAGRNFWGLLSYNF